MSSDLSPRSTPPPQPQPRRSGRQPQRVSLPGNPSPSAVGTKKRKASVTKRSTAKRSKKVTDEEDGEDGEDGEEEEDEEESSEDNEDDDDQSSGDEFGKPTKARKSVTKKSKPTTDNEEDDVDTTSKPKRKPSTRVGSGVKKGRGRPRGSKNAPQSDQEARSSPVKKAKEKKAPRGEVVEGAPTKGKKAIVNMDIEKDNVFFNALLSGLAFEPIVENWADTYKEDEDQALGDLVVFLIRAAGSSSPVTPDQAVDLDGVVSLVDDLEKEKSLGSYPLVSKDKAFKRFRPSLTSFISAFILNLAQTPILYSSSIHKSEPSPLIEVLQSWLFTLSHSPLRSFRHTGTVIALEVTAALCVVALEVKEELSVASRQREQEKKKVGKATGPAGKAAKERLKELESKVKEVHWKKEKLKGYLTEFFNTVFVMRYRDLDPNIRTECIKQLGIWMTTLPDMFLESAYFKYVGWMLDDLNSATRLETVRALSKLFADEALSASLSTFTERFKDRILEMAFHDVELSVRTVTIEILGYIDQSGMLEDEQRRQVGLLVFDAEVRIRKAVAAFFDARWQEEKEEMVEEIEASQRRGNPSSDENHGEEARNVLNARVGWKALASMLVRFSQALDNASAPSGSQDLSAKEDSRSLQGLGGGMIGGVGRIALAVDSLWDKVGPLRDWEGLAEFLCLDHSQKDMQVDENLGREEEDGWKLEEDEEGCLLDVLVAGLKKMKQEADRSSSEESTVATDMTRILINFLPKLIGKYQSNNQHLVAVLAIPLTMNLEMYLDLRMVTAYETLWNDVTRLFLKNSDIAILDASIAAFQAMINTEPLANTNVSKIAELDEALFSSLRTLVAGRDVYTAAIAEDEIVDLESCCLRIGLLMNYRDLTDAMDEDEGGKQSSGWIVLLALASRGTLGYKEERKLVTVAFEALARNVFWRTAKVLEDEARQPKLLEKRTALIQLIEECAIGTQSNAVDSVRTTSFDLLLRLHILFKHQPGLTPAERKSAMFVVPEPLWLTLEDEKQFRCAGFVQSEIERYVEERSELIDNRREANRFSDEEEDDDDDEEDKAPKPSQKKSSQNGKKIRRDNKEYDLETNEAVLVREHRFISLISSFVAALKTDVLNLEHAAIIFAHYGHFSSEYDLICRSLMDVIRTVACHGAKQVDTVVDKLVLRSLEDCFELFLDSQVDEATFVSLAKLLAGALVVHGPQFKILKRFDPKALSNLHVSLVDTFVKRLVQYQRNGNKSKAKKAHVYFRALALLCVGAEGKEALKIKLHMDEAFKKSEIEVTANKVWDSQRAYEKKLATVMSKDSRIASGARQQLARATSDNEKSPVKKRAAAKQPAQPTRERSKRKRSSAVMIENSDSEEEEEEEEREGEEEGGERTKKKARPKPKPRTSKGKANPKPPSTDGNEEEEEEELVMDRPPLPADSPQRPSKKPRSTSTGARKSRSGSTFSRVSTAPPSPPVEDMEVDEELLDMTQDADEMMASSKDVDMSPNEGEEPVKNPSDPVDEEEEEEEAATEEGAEEESEESSVVKPAIRTRKKR